MPSRPRPQLQLCSFFTVGRGRGRRRLGGSGPPHHPLISRTASSQAGAGPVTPLRAGRPVLSPCRALPAHRSQPGPGSGAPWAPPLLLIPPRKRAAAYAAGSPPSTRVLRHWGCPLGKGNSWWFWSAGGAGVKGGSPGAAGGWPCGGRTGPRCSGPGSVLGFPTLLLGPPQLSPASATSPRVQGGRGDGQLSPSRCAVVPRGAQPCCWSSEEGAGPAAPGGVAPGSSLQRSPLGEGRGRPCRGGRRLPQHELSLPSRRWDVPRACAGAAAAQRVRPGWGLQPPLPLPCEHPCLVLSPRPPRAAWRGAPGSVLVYLSEV